MGLYDEENKEVNSGDVLDVMYWQTKYTALKLEAALKSRQPEYAIRGIIPSLVNGCADVLKTYPNHGEVMKWLEHAREIEKKIDPNAAPAEFTSSFGHWRDYSYEMGWRSYHIAKMAADNGNWAVAHSLSADANTQFTRAEERMPGWAAEVRDWIMKSQEEMKILQTEAAKRM